MHQRLDEAVGVDAAATLMEHLQPTGWGDVVTREYLDMAIRTLEGRLDRQTRHTIFAMIGTVLGLAALAQFI